MNEPSESHTDSVSDGVKEGNHNSEQTLTNLNQQESAPVTVNYNGYRLPKQVYEDIKHTAGEITERRLLRELKKAGRLRSEDDSDPQENDPEEVQSLVRRLHAREKELEQMAKEKDQIISDIIAERLRSGLTQEAIQAGANPQSLDDFIERIRRDKRIRLEKDMQTMVVLDPHGNKQYNEDGSIKTVTQLVLEYRTLTPYYFKASTTAGAGGTYGSDELNPVDVGVPHLKNPRPPVIKKVAQQLNHGG
jgi:hypothetical protein